MNGNWIGTEQIESADGKSSEWRPREGVTTELRLLPGHTRETETDDEGRERNYGVDDAALYFILRGLEGAVTWRMDLGFIPRLRVFKTFGDGQVSGDWERTRYSPASRGVSSHFPSHQGPYEELGPQKCDVLESGVCYGDTGYGIGEELIEFALKKGHWAVFEKLQAHYDRFVRERQPRTEGDEP